jgi:RNA polymerase sigma-70 factor (ECF subfamily)
MEFGRHGDLRFCGAAMAAPELKAWFVREVLPLEAALMRLLRRSVRNQSDVDDLCQDIYVRVYEAARHEIPRPAKPFVFAIARNLLVDRVRREHVVPIEAVADLDALGVANDTPPPDRTIIAREELRRLQIALERLPRRCRQAVWMKKVDGLSRSEIAQRMGIAEKTVKRHLADGMCALADMVYGEAAETPEAGHE